MWEQSGSTPKWVTEKSPVFRIFFAFRRTEYRPVLSTGPWTSCLTQPRAWSHKPFQEHTEQSVSLFHAMEIPLQPGCACFQACLKTGFRWTWTQPMKQVLLHKNLLQGNSILVSHQVLLNWLNASDSFNSVALLLLTFWHHLGNWHSFSLSLCYPYILDWFLHWIKRRGTTSELLQGNKHICAYVKEKVFPSSFI